MVQLRAQPYNISANGFYFEGYSQHSETSDCPKNPYGESAEKIEIQFIDGDSIDCKFTKAWGHQSGQHQRCFFETVSA